MSIFMKTLTAFASSDSFNTTMDALEYDYFTVMRKYRARTVTPEKQQEMKDKLDPLGLSKNAAMKFSREADSPDIELPKGLFNIAGMEFKVELEPVDDDDDKDWIDELLEDSGVRQWLLYVDWIDRRTRKKTLKHSSKIFKFANWCLGSQFRDAINAMEKLVEEKMIIEDEEVA